MGLNLYHITPCKQDDNPLDFLLESDFAQNPTFWQRYAHLHAIIPDFDYDDFKIYVYPDVETKNIVMQLYGPNSPFLIGEIDTLNAEITQLARDNGMANNPSLTLKSIDNLLTEKHKKEISYHTVAYEAEKKNATALYYAEKGYQRKGMHPSFYEEFENDRIHFELADVVKAFSYIHSPLHGQTERLQKNFTQNFIDNFIEGESIFLTCW
ncbi:MAG TPA: hypothetical protein VK154_19395 [Chitinophagales bacterium]|nr:hypothetical protein [Chitinophagales bacterium]